jgi:HAD superfamily hydrolase (TIGR01509 family)
MGLPLPFFMIAESLQRAIIFDMDGLMVNTEPLSRAAWQAVLLPYGFTLSEEVNQQIIGHRIDRSAQIILEAYALPLNEAALIRQKNALFMQRVAQGVTVMPGLFALQAAIAERGITWGVATSSAQAHARKIISQLGLAADCAAIAGGDEVSKGKPAPDVYLLAAERLNIAPQHCLALEDSHLGCQSAAAAGLLTVVVGNQATAVTFPHADYIFSSLFAVADNLDYLLAQVG